LDLGIYSSKAREILLRLIHLEFVQGKSCWFRSSFSGHRHSQLCVAEIEDELEIGKVTAICEEIDSQIAKKIPSILREASAQDIDKHEKDKKNEKEAFTTCSEKIKEYNLPMKLTNAKSSFQEEKITFYFTSPERVDFRRLVKDLAAIFRCRIEFKQIGLREKAKMLGGNGPCGRALCCSSLKNFEPVTVRMAKEQSLPLDPLKIGGVCGKLRCCLRYELSLYKESKKQLPKKGSQVTTLRGTGEVVEVNPLKNSVMVKLESGVSVEISKEELQKSTSSFHILPRKK